MLHRLEVRNYVLIDSLQIEFPEGLVIISGQTGAGKSILLGALSLLMGSKADASLISEGADSCVVEAEFESPDSALRTIVEDAGAEWDDSSLILRRVLSSSGRSRAFINDCPFPVASLQTIGPRLVDIHSQHQTLQLLNPSYQIDLLDHFAGTVGKRKEYAEVYSHLTESRKHLESLKRRLEELKREQDYNASQLSQLQAANLRDGEMEELEEEHSRLSHAEEIQSHIVEAENALMPSAEEIPSVCASLKEASRALDKLSPFVQSCSSLRDRLDSARVDIEDVIEEIESISSGVDASPERLEQVEARMSMLYSLLSKHSCTTIKELIAVQEHYSNLVSDTSALVQQIADAEEETDRIKKNLSVVGESLSAGRKAAAPKFSENVRQLLSSLELNSAVFVTEVSPSAPSSYGEDNVTFLFSSTGRNPVPLANCASGGEMSRIMLCLKAMMAHFVSMPTMIFDEIDTGVSGSVADRMGSMICSMGRDMQVFAITHLPQVAAKGNAHYLVSKSEKDGKTISTISMLSPEQRVEEIARMLSGTEITPAAIANAKELLGL